LVFAAAQIRATKCVRGPFGPAIFAPGAVALLCSLAVDDKFEFDRLLDWQVGRLGAAQNFVDEVSGARERIRKLCAIGHQAARLGEVATAERRWQSGAQWP
jgi:hypothetical protein